MPIYQTNNVSSTIKVSLWKITESEEELIAAMSSPEGQKLSAALLEDEGNFIDHSKSSAFIVSEHEL